LIGGCWATAGVPAPQIIPVSAVAIASALNLKVLIGSPLGP
jgi:hypothetical protein